MFISHFVCLSAHFLGHHQVNIIVLLYNSVCVFSPIVDLVRYLYVCFMCFFVCVKCTFVVCVCLLVVCICLSVVGVVCLCVDDSQRS